MGTGDYWFVEQGHGTVSGSKPTADASMSGPSHLEQLKAALTTKKCSAAAAPAATTSAIAKKLDLS
ncbi:hypothetical protein B0H10DRAFT_2234877 [Mycena sp. CBHHK59/15]|nr:hypothetical protein B0H10DRAFT_2234877 [Mycena sp. CBHHK59/15]